MLPMSPIPKTEGTYIHDNEEIYEMDSLPENMKTLSTHCFPSHGQKWIKQG